MIHIYKKYIKKKLNMHASYEENFKTCKLISLYVKKVGCLIALQGIGLRILLSIFNQKICQIYSV